MFFYFGFHDFILFCFSRSVILKFSEMIDLLLQWVLYLMFFEDFKQNIATVSFTFIADNLKGTQFVVLSADGF